ncbi:MAG: tetratricopeptide repeat protein [Balneolaceae bacterium]|jgi:tetratricopeptide (TPR) repeat protein
MLKKKLPYLLITLLVGLLMGCSSPNPLADKAKSNIEKQDYQAALEAAEQSIEQHPDDPLGYYYKAVALGDLADQMDDPAKSADLYKQMNEAFDKAEDVASNSEKSPGELERIPSVKNVLWQSEHNRAVNLATDDSLKNTVQDPLKRAVLHLKNATMIQPDSALSWNVLAQIASMDQEYQQAAEAKDHYIKMIPDTTVKPNDYLQLASYYYQLDKQQEVLGVFQRAQKQFPENQDIVSNLADAYNRVGQPDKAIETVRQLVEKNPENPQYHLVLGTQIYQKALTFNDSLSANSDTILELQQKLKNASGAEAKKIQNQISQLEMQNNELQSQVDNLTDNAEKELKTTIEYRPKDDKAYNTLGIMYQNKAKAVFDKRNRTTDNEEAAKYDKQGKELLRKAMNYYESAAQIKPDNKDYWRSLFSIYTALGMDQKAQEAMKKAGMN